MDTTTETLQLLTYTDICYICYFLVYCEIDFKIKGEIFCYKSFYAFLVLFLFLNADF